MDARRLNARRLAFLIEKEMRRITRALSYTPAPISEQGFKERAETVLRDLDITEFTIVPQAINVCEFRASVGYRPSWATDYIWIEIVSQRSHEFLQTLRKR